MILNLNYFQLICELKFDETTNRNCKNYLHENWDFEQLLNSFFFNIIHSGIIICNTQIFKTIVSEELSGVKKETIAVSLFVKEYLHSASICEFYPLCIPELQAQENR